MSIVLDPRCAAFFAHWQSLRAGALVPTVAAFVDRPSPSHAPYLFMATVDGDDIIVRLEGTALVERWGRDITGQRLFATKSEEYRRAIAENFNRVIAHPCGCYALNEYMSGRQRYVAVHVLYLPLSDAPGRPARIVGYSTETEKRSDNELLVDRRRTVEAAWVDLGAGVPADPPNRAEG